MLTKRRRLLRAALAILFLAGGSLIALSLEQDNPDNAPTAAADSLLAEPELTLTYGRQQLQLDIASFSAEHEQAVRQVIREQFAGVQVRVEFHPARPVDSDWTALSTRLLRLIGATDSADVAIDNDVARIRGVSSEPAEVQQRLSSLRAALPADMALDIDILTTDSTGQVAELCARSFAPIAAQTIHFRQTSTQIRESWYPLLDRLIEFAYDCRDSKIAIIGHTDSTGDESWNVQVSLARAQTVADYVSSRGISPDRLLLEGVGSARPLGDNNTVAGRERNRRIEFELR